MEKFIEFAKKYNLAQLLLIFTVCLVLFVLYFGKQGAYMVDVGREAYIPWQMLQGKLLYKDIYNVYGPLGYQINTVAYALFGVHLNTLYFMGFLNSLIILFSTFYISKLFTDKKTALCIVGLTTFVCVYAKGFFNFIFVYSYSAVYALSGYLLSLLAMLFYIKDKKIKYLMLSFVMAGFSFANKIEYLPYFCLLFFVLPLFKLNWKQYLAAFASFMLFPILSFGILLIQGVSVQDLINAFDYIQKLVKTPAVEYFYNAYGLYFNPLHIKLALNYLFVKYIPVVVICSVILYALNYISFIYSNDRYIKKIVGLAIFVFMIFVNIKLFDKFQIHAQNPFLWMGIASVFIVLCFCLNYAFKFFKEKQFLANISSSDKMFLFLFFSALSVSVKGICDITLECYGTFSLAALFIPFVIFFVNYIPRIFPFINKPVFANTICNLCVMIIIAYLFLNVHRIGTQPLFPVKTDRGMIFVDVWLKSQNKLLHYIQKNIPKDATVVNIPEGALINFLTSKKSSDYYYYLIPVNVQVFGEDKILADFEKNSPDYFILNNIKYTPFRTGAFCDYSPKICNFLVENYKPVYVLDDQISFVVYKKK